MNPCIESGNLLEFYTVFTVDTVGAHMSPRRYPACGRSFSGCRIHFEQACGNQSRQVPKDNKRFRKIHNTCPDEEEEEVVTQEFDVIRSKFLNLHSIRSVIIAKLKTKSSKKVDAYQYKIDTDSNGNVMPIRMHEMLFLHRNINKLN